jgi:two-component system, chemotaxis family, protein-glutamate methylesterase/glutaminase
LRAAQIARLTRVSGKPLKLDGRGKAVPVRRWVCGDLDHHHRSRLKFKSTQRNRTNHIGRQFGIEVVMQQRDIVAIGASAGGITALTQLVRGLPQNFPGSIFIVQHLPASSPSALPEMLSRSGPLKAVHPKDGESIQPSRIYVAEPDHHLLIENGKAIVKRGPKENRFRPSIDALFRSAAYVYGSRVIGLVLTGVLDDGTSGLWTIKRLGGLALIQDPMDAIFPSMPINASEYVKVDHSVPIAEMANLLVELTRKPARPKRKLPVKDRKLLEAEILIATRDNAFEMGIIDMGELTAFTCPECHGALSRLKEGNIIRFRCHTGHAFTINALLSEVSENVEDLLWQGMRGLEESTMLLTEMAKRFEDNGRQDIARKFFKKAKEIKKRSKIVHDSVLAQELISGDLRFRSQASATAKLAPEVRTRETRNNHSKAKT